MKKIQNFNEKDFFRIISEIKNQNVVLYGAGKYGIQALNKLKEYNIKVKYFIDDNKVRSGNYVDGIPVISLEETIQILRNNFCIIIANYYVLEVLKKIEKYKFDLEKVYFCSELLIEDIDKEYIKEKKDKMQKVYKMLGDYQSKMIYRTMIESRFTKNIDLLGRTYNNNQYFPKDGILKLTDNEIFVDAGAFDGDTIEAFFKAVNYKFKYIYAFEPDNANYSKLLQKQYSKNIKVFNAGLYNKTSKLTFSANKGGSSKIEENGVDMIQVYKFDELELSDKAITFVKMDIEGSELKALEGMKNAIIQNRPKLAICIYHKFEDLWELPLYIKELVPEYKLYIRNYTTYLDEIVLYATI